MHDCWPYFGFESCTSITHYYTRCCLLNSGEACKQKNFNGCKRFTKSKSIKIKTIQENVNNKKVKGSNEK